MDTRWLRDKGARESWVSSAGREKPSSKSSSTDSMVGFDRGFAVIVETEKAFMVETPSSSSSKGVVCMGGRMFMTEGEEAELLSGLLISRFQSSSSLSDGAGIWAPSGRSKSASGHSSLSTTSVGGHIGAVYIT